MPQRSDLLFSLNVVANLKDPAKAMAIVSSSFSRLEGVKRAEIILDKEMPAFAESGSKGVGNRAYPITHSGGYFGYCVVEIDENFTARAQADMTNALKLVAVEMQNRRLSAALAQKTKDAEDRLSLVAKNMGDIVTITDNEGRIRWVNDAFVRTSGYHLDEIIDRRPGEFLHGPLTSTETKDYLRAAIRNREPAHCEIINYRKSGEPYWIEFSVTPVSTPDGSPEGYIGVGREITRRRKAEDNLRRRNALLQEVEKVGHVGGWEIIPHTGEIIWSDETYRIFGMKPGEPLNEDKAIELLDPPSREKVVAASGRAIADGTPWDIECTGSTRDGKPIHLVSRGRVEEVNGEVRLYGAVLDVTQFHEEQEQKKRLTERLAIATEAGQMGLWEWDIEKHTLHLDDRLMKLFGFKAGTSPVPIESWICRIHMEDRLSISQNMEDIRSGGPVRSFRYRFLRDDGTTQVIQTSGPTTIGDRVVGIAWDAREDVARETTLKQALDKAKDASRAKSAFLTQMSHELRTPLNAIIGFSDLLKDMRDLPPETIRDYAIDINESGKGLLSLINEILDFSSLESGRRLPEVEDLDLSAVARSVLRTIRRKHGHTAILCINESLGEYAPIRGDVALLKQLVHNLISNAIRCNQSKPSIDVTVDVIDGKSVLRVSDHGGGMNRNDMARLFEPFFDLDDPYRSENYGSGLYLAIVKLIAELHDATISSEDIPGGGTAVMVTFPAPVSSWRPSGRKARGD